jgi:phosphoribosyl-AMP cyclohydrolase
VPAIIQQHDTGEVLMLGWMDAEALRRTLTEGRVTFWSRSRQEYWRKGDTSGHAQYVRGARLDCDGDTLLIAVEQIGAACHTGDHTCFDADDLSPLVSFAPLDPTATVVTHVHAATRSAIIAGGALAIISSTQTWLDVALDAGATASLPVAGARRSRCWLRSASPRSPWARADGRRTRAPLRLRRGRRRHRRHAARRCGAHRDRAPGGCRRRRRDDGDGPVGHRGDRRARGRDHGDPVASPSSRAR